MVRRIRQELSNNTKNVLGWKTARKIIVFAVDDYGNVRIHSRKAREKMDERGLKIHNRFDAYDTLETRRDLDVLFHTLDSVRDIHGCPAVFTPFALPCNIDFEKVIESDFSAYFYETVPETFAKLAAMMPDAYEGAWSLWQEGMAKGMLHPEFHGREHLNLKVFREKIAHRDKETLIAMNNRSYASISNSGYPTIKFTAAFEFWEQKENDAFEAIISDGAERFREVFGYRPLIFNPPGGREHQKIHSFLDREGIRYLDSPLLKREHLGKGKYRKILHFLGQKNQLGQTYLVRNVRFEPNKSDIDWVGFAMQQIAAAFRWKRPAIISSHRINFCGHIDPDYRTRGIGALRQLLKKIVDRWPDVEFMSASDLGRLISADRKAGSK